MLILKILGITLFISGVLLALYTFINAKNTGFFKDIEELKRIKETGYTKEHKEERREDFYRREPIAQQSRLISRRAQRVLEKMNEEQLKEEVKPQGVAMGTSLLEEVRPQPAQEAPPIKKPKPLSVTTAEESTAPLTAHTKSSEEATGVLDTEDGTDFLKQEEATGALPSLPEEQTDVLINEEGTDMLMETSDEGTDVLDQEEGTDILPKPSTGNTKASDASPDEEGTAVLTSSEEATGVLGDSDSEATDILVPTNDEEDTAVLDRKEN